jgi:hypothetical protein
MNARQAFGVVVRAVGLVVVLYGLYTIVTGIAALTSIQSLGNPGGTDAVWSTTTQFQWSGPFMTAAMILSAAYILAGLLLLRGADRIVRFAYPGREYERTTEDLGIGRPETF